MATFLLQEDPTPTGWVPEHRDAQRLADTPYNLKNRGESLEIFWSHLPPLGLPMMYPPTGQATPRRVTSVTKAPAPPPPPSAPHHPRGVIPREFLVAGCRDLDPPCTPLGTGVERESM